MGLSIGIVGLPNVGKSTLFNALLGQAQAHVANYPFCTIEPNLGVVPVPDERLTRLSAFFHSEKTTFSTIEFVDIAGLVAGASKGEGLGNQFLANIRQVDAVAHVLRCFDDPDVVRVSGGPDPRADRDTVETEMMLKDLEQLERRREKVVKDAKAPGKPGEHAHAELAALDRVKAGLESGVPVRAQRLSEEERGQVRHLQLLTQKPVVYIANVDERQLADPGDARVAVARALAAEEGAPCVVICGKVEAELAELGPADRLEYLKSLGLQEPGLDRLVRAGYQLLGLVTFFTVVGRTECRAWTVRRGTRAHQAAGAVHSDFERGFIKAEVIGAETLLAAGSEHAAREKGLLRVEGRDYVVQDGDVIHFRFSV